jgi:hypothetical protein
VGVSILSFIELVKIDPKRFVAECLLALDGQVGKKLGDWKKRIIRSAESAGWQKLWRQRI